MPLTENDYKKKRPENYRGSGWIASRPKAEAHRGEQAMDTAQQLLISSVIVQRGLI